MYLNGEDIRNLSTREKVQKMAILSSPPPTGLTVGELVASERIAA
ncbi:hypothetical protein [Dendrosporobacter quercicolus]|nr:hypothetical protein [Dendrosporobacter quercicolus]